jgi:hypothetical protein
MFLVGRTRATECLPVIGVSRCRTVADARYLTERLTAGEIAQLCGWASQYVRDRRRGFGIPLRRPGT